MTNDDVAGASALTNLADNVLSIEKPNIRLLKNRDFGITGTVVCAYDPSNHRIYEKARGDVVRYEWDHVGVPEAQNPAHGSPGFEITDGGAKMSSLPF